MFLSILCFAFYFVFSPIVWFRVFYLPMYIVVHFVFVYNFTYQCQRAEQHLHLRNIIFYSDGVSEFLYSLPDMQSECPILYWVTIPYIPHYLINSVIF